uniref:Trehalose 6-phosphate phosphatase n=1 Tax=Lactuca sativa TaxID=4236 RepID=A0A9R1W7P3_LACSA|nr:hypothetical protein LSAT_V11C300156280 [Lactuca sativa]
MHLFFDYILFFPSFFFSGRESYISKGNILMGLLELSTNENEYLSWLKKHPSALETFDEIIVKAKGDKIVVFLDYDGTLSNIVPNPDEAFMSKKMKTVVGEVARCFPTAIISGRSRDKVYEFVKLDDIYYAGSHGLDIAAPFQCIKVGDSNSHNKCVDKNGDEVVLFQPAQKYLPSIYKNCINDIYINV